MPQERAVLRWRVLVYIDRRHLRLDLRKHGPLREPCRKVKRWFHKPLDFNCLTQGIYLFSGTFLIFWDV